MINLYWRPAGAVAALLVASGCASIPLEQGRSQVGQLVAARSLAAASNVVATADSREAATSQISQWLSEPLTVEAAQRIALLRNPGLQAQLAGLGISAADVFEAGRLHNPSISLSWLLPLAHADGSKVGASATLGFTDLLLRGARQRIAQQHFEAVQQDIAAKVLGLLADTQQAWINCVGATQKVNAQREIADAASLGADLAQRYRDAGNIGELDLQVQRAEATQAGIDLQTMQMKLADARAQLQSLLGLREEQGSWRVPETLPEIPARAALPTLQQLQDTALQQRLDLVAARSRAGMQSLSQQTVRRYRMLGSVNTGAAFEREADGSSRLGPSLELELPLFQQGQSAAARADAELALANAEVSRLEIQIQAEVRKRLQRLELAGQQVSAYRDGLIPQREAIVARIKEQANFMLVDNFTTLQARQQEYAAWSGYIDAIHGYWTSQVELLRATGSARGMEESP